MYGFRHLNECRARWQNHAGALILKNAGEECG